MVQGHHRVNWDLRYPGATEFPGLIMWAASSRGPLAPPGPYQVRLTADGVTQTRPFRIERETRLLKDVTDSDLQAQFDLAMQVRNKASQANDAILLIRGIKGQVDERIKKLDVGKTGKKPSPTLLAARSFNDKLSAVEGEIYQVKNQSSQDPLNFPIKTNNRLASLLRVAVSGEGRPTGNVEPIFGELVAELRAETERLDKVIADQLTSFNSMLLRVKKAPITP